MSRLGWRSLLPVVAAGTIAVDGCGARGVPGMDVEPDAGQVVTADDIANTGATTAWDALRLTVHSHYFYEYRGQPVRVSTDRGVGSFVLREEPLVFVDRARLADIQVLRYMPAGEIASIRVLNGADGTTYFGTSAVAGVILIRTWQWETVADTTGAPPDTTRGRGHAAGSGPGAR